jgi:transposase
MTRPAIIEVDLTAVHDVLERSRAQLSPEDHACLAGVVQSLIEVARLVRERGTTIARLRRLFGLHSSEKLKDLLGDVAPASSTNVPDLPPSSETAPSGDPSSTAEPPSTTPRDDAPVAADHDRDAPSDRDAAQPDAHPKRTGHGRIGASEYPDARRIRVEHDRLHAGDACPGCAHGKLYCLREPARIVRIIGQAPLAATAWDCDRLRCSGCGDVFTARAPAEAQGAKYDHTAVAMMGLLRYRVGVPLHRLGRLQHNLKTPVPASTQWEVARDHVGALEPVFEELRRRAADGRVQYNDDTSMRILALMGKRRSELLEAGQLPDPERTGLFTTAVVSDTDDGPIALFFTGRNHAGENLTAVLAQRDPALPPPIHMCDGLDRNRPRGHAVVESNCLCHGRRHVVDEIDNFPAECRHVLEALGKVFHNEETCRQQALSDDDRLTLHQRESAPVMAELERWMNAELDEHRVEPNSGLGQAFGYLLKRWTQLTLFLRVPGAPLDNNLCERVLKMAIRHRNNSLFYRTERGAEVGDVYMTLIATTELHHENPFDYLVALFVHEAEVAADPSAWLPWTFRATLARASRAAA